MIQELIVFGIVALAVAYLVRTLWLSARGKAGCNCDSGGCGKAKPGTKDQAGDNLVQITMNFNGSAPKRKTRT